MGRAGGEASKQMQRRRGRAVTRVAVSCPAMVETPQSQARAHTFTLSTQWAETGASEFQASEGYTVRPQLTSASSQEGPGEGLWTDRRPGLCIPSQNFMLRKNS